MAKNETWGRLDNKIENTAKDLRENIDKLGGESVKRSELQHYATRHSVLWTFLVLFGSICTAYWLITPLMIDSKNSKFEHKLDEVLTTLKPATDNKIK